jgi:Concanavalin A-like lectin/glucanases superfamily/IPT/TIG domain
MMTLQARTVAAVVVLCVAAVAQNMAGGFTPGGGWVETPHNNNLVPTAGITVEAWVKVTSFTGSHSAIVRKNSDYLNASYLLRVSGSNLVFFVKTNANSTVNTPSYTLNTGIWYHVAATFDNAVARLYVNGNQVTQLAGLTGPMLNTGNSLKIGNGDGEPWNGSIDCVRIWSSARTQQQIQAMMPYQIEDAPGLVSSWHLNGNYLDSTGSNHGIVTGGLVPFVPGAPLTPQLGAPAISPVGAPLVYQINNATPSKPYILDVSVTGSSPGVPIGPGLVIPLNPPFLNYETGASLSSLFVNFFGVLNAAGHASPYVNVPAMPSLSGVVVHAAYVTLDPLAPLYVDFISGAVQTTLGGLPPTITSVAPPTGVTSGGTPIAISGTNFQPGATVEIGATQATGVMVTSPTSIVCTTPAGTLGPKSVKVTNPDTFSATLTNGFTYVLPLLLTQVTPLIAPAGALILVTGAGIQPGATVTAGGIPVTPQSLSPTQITFTNPPLVPCNTTVQVTNPDSQTASRPFNPSPTLTALIPSSGPVAGGNTITVLGLNFVPGTIVTVNAIPVTFTPFGSGMSVVMPPGAPGPAVVAVASPNGCSISTTYTYF